MRENRIDWRAAAAVIAGGICTAALYGIALAILFGPLAHALSRAA